MTLQMPALTRRVTTIASAIILAVASILPLLISGQAGAAQITNRTVAISSSQEDALGVDWDFEFDYTSADIRGIIFQFCDSPLGTCTLPTGLDVSNDLVSPSGQANFNTNATAFAEQATNLNDCSDTGSASTVTMYCLDRTGTSAAVGTDASLVVNDITNATVASTFTTVYVRISLYTDDTYTTKVHEGTVAAVMTNQLTVSGRVQERLVFCVGALGDADANPTSCATGDGFPTDITID